MNSLSEPPANTPPLPTLAEWKAERELSSPPKIKDPCPKCGGRSAKSKRTIDSIALYYCVGGCLSEDRTDAYYFTTVAETFVEAAERYEAEKPAFDFEKEWRENNPPRYCKDCGAQETYEQFNLDKECQCGGLFSVNALPSLLKVTGEQQTAEAYAEIEEIIANDQVISEMDNVLDQAMAAVTKRDAGELDLFGEPIVQKEVSRAGNLATRFLVPPFSVLDARQGYWQDRKREWVAMGLSGEDGRVVSGENAFSQGSRDQKNENKRIGMIGGAPMPLDRAKNDEITSEDKIGGMAGTSIFDPVLTEICYKWFCPEGGKILDPFAGGSTRGVVAAKLGYDYTGIELRPEQIAANETQAAAMGVAPRWINGDSSKMSELIPEPPYEEKYDMIFACPPYYDLEQYSEMSEDGSCKQSYSEFIAWYRDIFKTCLERLKWNRFVVIVVGEIRDRETGFYRNFVSDTVSAMLDIGLKYYNEAILVTAIGSLPLRTGKQFAGYRKIGKTHQNVLCFYHGSNCDQIMEKFGDIL